MRLSILMRWDFWTQTQAHSGKKRCWRSEDNFVESVLSFCLVGSGIELSHQGCFASILPTEPSCWPQDFFFFKVESLPNRYRLSSSYFLNYAMIIMWCIILWKSERNGLGVWENAVGLWVNVAPCYVRDGNTHWSLVDTEGQCIVDILRRTESSLFDFWHR